MWCFPMGDASILEDLHELENEPKAIGSRKRLIDPSGFGSNEISLKQNRLEFRKFLFSFLCTYTETKTG